MDPFNRETSLLLQIFTDSVNDSINDSVIWMEYKDLLIPAYFEIVTTRILKFIFPPRFRKYDVKYDIIQREIKSFERSLIAYYNKIRTQYSSGQVKNYITQEIRNYAAYLKSNKNFRRR